MFKKEINNAPLTHLGGKGGYYRKLLIVFVLIFTLIVPFSVSALVSNDDKVTFNSSEISPTSSMLSYVENIYGLSYEFTSTTLENNGVCTIYRPTSNSNWSLTSSYFDYSFEFVPPSFSLMKNYSYKVKIPVVLQVNGTSSEFNVHHTSR